MAPLVLNHDELALAVAWPGDYHQVHAAAALALVRFLNAATAMWQVTFLAACLAAVNFLRMGVPPIDDALALLEGDRRLDFWGVSLLCTHKAPRCWAKYPMN